MTNSMPMIKLNLKFEFPSLPMHFILQANKGEKIAIVGASGAGKSTLLNLMGGFLQCDGELYLDGVNHLNTPPHLRPLSILFQNYNLFSHLTVAENLALGIKPSLHISAEEKSHLETMAETVGLGSNLNQLPQNLSGGQQQRTALARCLLRKQPILLLDEPFSGLDPDLRKSMENLVFKLCNRQNLTLIMVTHHLNEVQEKLDKVYQLANGILTLI